ncbi:SDR family NAD(P)-dependent oxidoreductase [Rhodococcus gannanensis]|uniref:SDR family NAD(P)-dependent oxidoreductase n=1 Tax=Rhodococcus gannanensis TaxID=1960308 RepID=A0ABW4PCL6_9NOCA
MTDKSALVTGASRGIGFGIASSLAAQGYSLTLSARDEQRLAEVADTLKAAGAPRVVAVAGDLADPDAVGQLAQRHTAEFGAMDALIVNAGVGTAGEIGEFPMRRFDKTVAVNLRAPVQLLQECLPLLRAGAAANPGRGAKVVALSSITGVYSEAQLGVYGATKAALVSLVSTFNAEESGRGVTATAISPAYVDTDMSAWIKDRIAAESMIEVGDIVELVDSLLRLSSKAVVPNIVVTRAGTDGYRA